MSKGSNSKFQAEFSGGVAKARKCGCERCREFLKKVETSKSDAARRALLKRSKKYGCKRFVRESKGAAQRRRSELHV